MNETLKEHLSIKNPSTGTGKEMLKIEEISGHNANYAANTYLVALNELARLRAERDALREALREFDVEDPIGVSAMWLPAFKKARAALLASTTKGEGTR